MLWELLWRRVLGSYDKLREGGHIYSLRGMDMSGLGNSLYKCMGPLKEQRILGGDDWFSGMGGR